MQHEFRNIPTDLVVDAWVILRPVKRKSIEFLEMKTSIDEIGLLSSVAVRASHRKPGKYEVIDGMYRTTCMRELEWEEIPCVIKEGVTDQQVMAFQIQANAIRPFTTPVQFARQLKRILKASPDMTFRQIASMVNKNPQWVKQQLGLLCLDEKMQLAVDRGEIVLSNAYMLAAIPSPIRAQYFDQAKAMKVVDFKLMAGKLLGKHKEQLLQGKWDVLYPETFKPTSYLRPLKELKAELANPTAGSLVLAEADAKTVLDGWTLALKWMSHMDSNSLEEQRHAAEYRANKSWKGA